MAVGVETAVVMGYLAQVCLCAASLANTVPVSEREEIWGVGEEAAMQGTKFIGLFQRTLEEIVDETGNSSYPAAAELRQSLSVGFVRDHVRPGTCKDGDGGVSVGFTRTDAAVYY